MFGCFGEGFLHSLNGKTEATRKRSFINGAILQRRGGRENNGAGSNDKNLYGEMIAEEGRGKGEGQKCLFWMEKFTIDS